MLTNELGGRRVLAAYVQAPVPVPAMGTETIGESPAQAAEPRSKALGWPVTVRRRTGSRPRAPPVTVLPSARLGGKKKAGPMCVGPAINDQGLSAKIVMSHDRNNPRAVRHQPQTGCLYVRPAAMRPLSQCRFGLRSGMHPGGTAPARNSSFIASLLP